MLRSTALLLVLAGLAAALATGCTPHRAGWDGRPWTNTHPERCRQFAPITWDWVAAHPDHPCAQVPPVEPDPAVELGPACTQEIGAAPRCSGGRG